MSKTTYSLRPMPPAVTCKYYCSDRDKFGALCFNKATYYLVATRPNKRPAYIGAALSARAGIRRS